MRTPAWTVLSVTLLLVTHSVGAVAETLPTRGTTDPRVRTALYRVDDVYRLFGVVGYEIELVFEEGEVFTGRAGGDLDGVAIDGFANHVHVKPRAPIVATNLVIYTNKRAYRFDYSSVDHPPGQGSEEMMYAVQFRYPPDAGTDTSRGIDEVSQKLEGANALSDRNVDYWYCGHPGLKPIAASDDGVRTRLEFGSRAELPAVFVRNDDGSESLLNFSVEDGDIVIQRIARRFVVRRGGLTGCIVNQGFTGGGNRLATGTLSPDVQRTRKGVRP